MISVVLNPRARRLRKDPRLLQRLRDIVGSTGRVSMPEGREALDAWAREAVTTSQRIAICGGDGTAHTVLTAIDRAGRPEGLEVMLLHGGTMNTIARSMGHQGRAEDQLAAWVRELSGGPSLPRVERAPLRIEGRTGFLFGIGIVPRFIEAYESGPEPSTVIAAMTLGRAVASAFTGGAFAAEFFAGIEAEVEGDGTAWPTRSWRILTVGAVRKIGLEFEPFPGVATHPGHMHAFASASSPLGFARDLIPLRLGRPAQDAMAHDQVCRRLRIRTMEPIQYNLDGDLYETGTELLVESGAIVPFVLGQGSIS